MAFPFADLIHYLIHNLQLDLGESVWTDRCVARRLAMTFSSADAVDCALNNVEFFVTKR